jgi:DNA helicase HerA-like ATPase
MDPIKDAEEFNALLHTEPDRATFNGQEFLRELLLSGDPARQKLAKRIDNLQVLNWDVWALSESNITDTVAERPDVTVADLGGFEVADESKTAALAILEDLWKRRSERRPILIVIDEAHNLCPAEPNGPLEQALTDQLIQIAAEGRKFGLWLLLSTQRPTKIHQNVLSQCDNLALLRMNAPRDLQEIESVFGFAPAELIRRSSRFTQGQVLFAGGFVEEPTVAQMGLRLTAEGGADVKVPIPDVAV